MTANKPMTGEQLDELMTIAVNMQRDSEKVSDRPAAMFAYAVQVAVLELRKVRNEAAALAEENAGIKAAIDATIRWQQSTDPENVESVRMLVDVKTPATDAFLAEVRASAITDALKSLDVVFDTDCVMESNGISYEDAEQRTAGAYAVSKVLEDFAAQIRKGVRS
ncbi:hypothetical protein KK084_22060 [Enterobacter hormaechei subsp. xiangfangensis]|nr:hypothetical protein [Enterobacter hormaechei subsp. xiangfangensis]